MKAKTLAVAVASLFAATAMAQEAVTVNGSVSVGGISSDTSATKDEAKFQEYRDLKDGGIADVNVEIRGARQWLDIFGENIGRRDQYMDIRGGYYGLFRGRLYLNDIIHNEGFNLITPYSGVGTNALRAPVTGTGANGTFNTNVGTWNPFNLGIDRRHLGASADVRPASSPFYVSVEATEQKREGVRIQGAANGTSPGNGFQELPIPIDYVTRVVAGEAGYSSRDMHFALNVSKSKFTNQNETVTWTNPYFGGGVDTSTYSPSSDQTKWSLNGLFKRLPWDSQLAGRFTHTKLTDDVPLLAGVFNTGNTSTILPTPANVTNFSGENVWTTGSLALTSRPTRVIDTKFYYNYYRKENKSSEVVFTGQPNDSCGAGSGTICEPDRFDYTKKNWGAELWYRFAGHTKAIAGFDYVDLDRNRVDFDNTKDKKGYLELRTDAWETAAIRVRYQRLQRRSHFLEGDAGDNANDPEFINRFVRRFDASNVDQDLLKIAVDASVMPLLDLGAEAYFKHNKYKDTVLGRTKDDRQEIYVSAAYGDVQAWRINAFADAEYIRYDSTHRTINGGTCTAAAPNCFDPIGGTQSSFSFNWDGKVKERNYAAGIAGDWMVGPRIKLNAAYTYQKTEGSVDFSFPGLTGLTPLVNIPNVDDVKIHTFSLKGVYKATPAIDLTGGYAYEKYEFKDSAWDNYANVVAGGTPNQRSYLTGAYAFPQYKANILYVMVTYRFH
ncbi:MAG TPA: MtrB/PioB family outer membrane beta-barrel protein [Usitatibacter sp.]|nr:MtrB/PioB family outer membrane beta-barrel protein [Usitatibacter sp.]